MTDEVYDDVKQALAVLEGVEMQGQPFDAENARMVGRTLADVTEHLRAERGYADEKWQEHELQTAISNWKHRATTAEAERDQLRDALEPEAVGEYIQSLPWGVFGPRDKLTWNEAYTLVVGNIRAFAAHVRNADSVTGGQ